MIRDRPGPDKHGMARVRGTLGDRLTGCFMPDRLPTASFGATRYMEEGGAASSSRQEAQDGAH
jgi:hypothetical protein